MNTRIGQQIGNYRLVRLLGQGGFAEVYLATHIYLHSPVAIKLLLGQITKQMVQEFLGEAQIISALKHPAIVRVLDFGFEQAFPFLVMEYIPDGSLRNRHPHGSTVALETVIPYVKDIASALAHAHNHQLIHRDVKPENMLVHTDQKILLSDFGIVAAAHNTTSMKTIDGTGTVPYMAPEQIQGKPRPASDQYSLAVTVYEWLSGERPFIGNAPIEIAMKHLSEKPVSLRQRGLDLPTQVDNVILKALAKDPKQRFPDVLTFAQALEQASQSPKENLFSALFSSFSLKGIIPPTQSITQKQDVPPTQPFLPQQLTAEEEMLLTYIWSLSLETSNIKVIETQGTIISLIKKYAQPLQKSNDKRKILQAFNNALDKTATTPIYGDGARQALITCKAKYLSLWSI